MLQTSGGLRSIYRLWKCTNDGIVENLGLGAVNDRNPNLVQNEMRSGRNYWFPVEVIGRSASVSFTSRKPIESRFENEGRL